MGQRACVLGCLEYSACIMSMIQLLNSNVSCVIPPYLKILEGKSYVVSFLPSFRSRHTSSLEGCAFPDNALT